MSPRQRRFTAEEIVQILRKNGFEKVSQRGSHQKWRNKASGHQLIIPFHKGKQLPLGTLKSIMEGSGLDPSVFQ